MKIIILAIFLAACTPSSEFLLCPEDNCYDVLLQHIYSSDSARCALYTSTDEIKDAANKKGFLIEKNSRSALMHNKFCVFNNSVLWTGSLNPTNSSANNSVIILRDKKIVQEFNNYHAALGKNKVYQSKHRQVLFCPQDKCEETLQRLLSESESSIFFASYSFTHSRIANELRLASQRGVLVKGTLEKNKLSQYSTLSSISTVVEHNRSSIYHHKLFIIDNQTVIIGSANPTINGLTNNDENILILKDENIANEILKKFDS